MQFKKKKSLFSKNLVSFVINTKQMNKVVLIDDDPVNNFVNRRLILKLKKDCEIKEFLNAGDALEYLKGNEVDVIFLDLAMHDIDGWGFLDEYKKIGLKYPVFILTTSIDPLDRIRAEQYPELSGFLIKPLTVKEIESIVLDKS
jgi:CheY-like chemotaxis protein